MKERTIVHTWERLVRYHRTATTAINRQLRSEFGYSLDDYDVLYQINAHDGPIRMGDLADNLLVANSSCNRIVGRLVDAGFVERSHGDSDGRVVLVDLTGAGVSLRRRMAVAHTRGIESRFGALITSSQAGDFDAILRRLLDTPTRQQS